MIVTVTLNAALQVTYEAERIIRGAPNHVSQVRYRAGGQGLAIARTLAALGQDVLAAGLAGGAAGELITADLARSGVPAQFTVIGRESRRVLEVADTAYGDSTLLNEPAPFITTEELGRLAADYRLLMKGATAVVLSGGLPAGLPVDVYASLASYAAEAGVPVIIDASGPALWHGLARQPALVVPGPAGGVAGPDGTAGAAHEGGNGNGGVDPGELLARGAGAVAMLPGSVLPGSVLPGSVLPGSVLPGSVLADAVTSAGRWRATLDGYPGLRLSRDALVAGLLPAVVEGWSWPDTLRHAVALGAVTDLAGEPDLDAYELVLSEVSVGRRA